MPDYSTAYGILCVVRTTLKNTGYGSFATGLKNKENIHIRIEVFLILLSYIRVMHT